jgi:hypothetical protein
MTEEVTEIRCGIRDAQASKTCEPFDDPRSHDFQGWEEFDDGRGGTTVCTRCGISAFSHAMRYAP